MDGKFMNDDIKVGDWVKCIDSTESQVNLTRNKLYQVLEVIETKFLLASDNGKILYWYKKRFVKYVNKKNHLPVWF